MDERRLRELYEAYGPSVYAQCRRILREPAAAEDATQETFLRVLRHLDKVPDGRDALSWIHRVATNYCLTELRSAQLRPEPIAEFPELAGRNLDEVLANREFVRRFIADCPPKVRPVAWLCYVDGMGQAEIALLLDISRRTVVNRLAEFRQFAGRFVQRVNE